MERKHQAPGIPGPFLLTANLKPFVEQQLLRGFQEEMIERWVKDES